MPTKVRGSRASILAHPAVASLHQEQDDHNGRRWNWWCYLLPGWECRSMECGTIHEHTLREVAELLNTDVGRVRG